MKHVYFANSYFRQEPPNGDDQTATHVRAVVVPLRDAQRESSHFLLLFFGASSARRFVLELMFRCRAASLDEGERERVALLCNVDLVSFCNWQT